MKRSIYAKTSKPHLPAASDRLQQLAFVKIVDLSPEPVDIDVGYIRTGIKVVIPAGFFQCLADEMAYLLFVLR